MQTPFSCQPSAFFQILLAQRFTAQNGTLLFIHQIYTFFMRHLLYLWFVRMITHCWHTCRGNQQDQALPFPHTCRNMPYLESWDEKKTKHHTSFSLHASSLFSTPPQSQMTYTWLLFCGWCRLQWASTWQTTSAADASLWYKHNLI